MNIDNNEDNENLSELQTELIDETSPDWQGIAAAFSPMVEEFVRGNQKNMEVQADVQKFQMEQQLVLKSKQLELSRFQFEKENETRIAEMQIEEKQKTRQYRVIVGLSVAVFILTGFLFYQNDKELAIKVLSYVVTIFLSWIGGVGYEKVAKQKKG